MIIAPEFEADALDLLRQKKNLRLLKMLCSPVAAGSHDLRSVGAESYLWQQRDLKITTEADLKVVTQRAPSPAELEAMLFGWRVVKHLKSNAILYCGAQATLGVGAGQMSRVDSSRIAVWKAGEAGLDLKGSVVCSDAFFPFADGLIAAAQAGATAELISAPNLGSSLPAAVRAQFDGCGVLLGDPASAGGGTCGHDRHGRRRL